MTDGLARRTVTVDPLAIYHELLVHIWEDGVLTSKERAAVAALKERLGITAEEHAHLERQVIDHLFPDGLPDQASV